MAWVGHTTIHAENIQEFLEDCQTTTSRYFLRWPGRVSGFEANLPPDELSPEGQLFDGDRELRWRRKDESYSVLLLSDVDSVEANQPLNLHGQSFQAIGTNWETRTWNAHVYSDTETRLPAVVSSNGVNVHQRHFIDQTTATVRFTALVVALSSNQKKEGS
jgi:hypothetical protein